MRISQITVNIGLTLSPKQYESVRADASVTVDLGEGEDPAEAWKLAAGLARAKVQDEAADIIQYIWKGRI